MFGHQTGSPISNAESQLKVAANWFASNKLSLNLCFMIFTPPGSPYPDNITLKIGETSIDRVCYKNKEKAFKFVGTWLSKNLD